MKLNQIIAIANGKKSQAQSALTAVHHKVQKPELLAGISRTYRPKDDDGEKLPPESKRVQYTVGQAITEAAAALTGLFDTVAAQDLTNCSARADVLVDGKAVLSSVPVTHLLFIEKQLVDLHTFVEKFPTLDPADEWAYRSDIDCYATAPTETTRTKKVPKAFEASPATKEHPAQVQVFNEDVLVGYWSQVKFSGAIPAKDRNAMLERVRKLQDAVKIAREEANSADVIPRETGKPVLAFVFGEYSAA